MKDTDGDRVMVNGVETTFSVRTMTGPDVVGYPKNGFYEFQEFAGLVFELGGYGDITLINPYNNQRLWVGQAFPLEEWVVSENGESPARLFTAMRRAIDVAEAVGFMEDD